MKLLLMSDDSYPYAGGTTRVLKLIADDMAARGHEILVVGPQSSHDDTQPVHRARSLRPAGVPQGTLIPSRDDLQRVIDFKPDVIHTHTERGAFFWAQRLRDKLNVPHVHTLHADYSVLHPHHKTAALLTLSLYAIGNPQFNERVKVPQAVADYYGPFDPILKLDWQYIARLAGNVDFFTTPSPRIYEFTKLNGLAERGMLLPLGIKNRTPKQKRQHEIPTILTVGRLAPEKRPMAVLEAYLELRNKGSHAKLTIVGEGDELKKLQKKAASSDYGKDVTFYGLIKNRADLDKLYEEADLFVLGSYHFETQGLVLLEAAAAGLPIVYCDERLNVGATPENAILTGPSPIELAGGLKTLVDDPSLRKQMSAASFHEAARYPIDATMDEFESLYRRITSRR